MDVFIKAPQGGGKTTAAMILTAGYHATTWNAAEPRALVIDNPVTLAEWGRPENTVEGTARMLVERGYKTVIFDGCLTKPRLLTLAQSVIAKYRTLVVPGRDRRLLAIYIVPDNATVIAD